MITQRYIEGTHVNPENIKKVMDEFMELLRMHSQSVIDTGVGLDFVGLEGALKGSLFRFKKYRGTIIDIYLITPALEIVATNWNLPKLLELWKEGVVPELANIMINENGDIFVVDLSLTENHPGINIISRTRARVIEMYNRYYLRRYFQIEY